MQLDQIIDYKNYPVSTDEFRNQCKDKLDKTGALTLTDFLQPAAIESIRRDGENNQQLAYFTKSAHNVYLSPPEQNLSADHPRNREVTSSKGCITTDQIPADSALTTLYDSTDFRDFLCAVLGIEALHEYADPLSSINLHYASAGQELGWHFDNSSFAITLLIQAPQGGGQFEYVKDLRNAEAGDMNYDNVASVLDGNVAPDTLDLAAGTLSLFRGRNSMHRVTPVEGETTRMLVVLAYNTEPGVSLSESARMTFYGRLE